MTTKFFFPDSQDQVDPTFNFTSEERSIYRVRQRDDRYAHEALGSAPFDGFLVSKTIVDGFPGVSGKYTSAQRHRLYRVGIREFFRLDHEDGERLQTMGDCGAFSYVQQDRPPYTPDEVIDFYSECRFDFGMSVDHVILGYDPEADDDAGHPLRSDWQSRQELTLELAAKFRRLCRARKVSFEPLGVAQGWSPGAYALSVKALQKMGYRRIALGGMVPLKTVEILACLGTIDEIRRPDTQFHLLGVTRCDHIDRFATFGVTSFDSTSPFRQAFKDDTDNYYALDHTPYTALRVPQVDANPKLRAQIQAGQIRQEEAAALERECLRALQRYDAEEIKSPKTVVRALTNYEALWNNDTGRKRKDRSEAYLEMLTDRPWRSCRCGLCREIGIEIALFRGSERNKRRGFHNLYVFNRQLKQAQESNAA